MLIMPIFLNIMYRRNAIQKNLLFLNKKTVYFSAAVYYN